MTAAEEIYGRYWSEAEYLIVLHYYVRNAGKPRHHLCDYVIDASRLLGRTPGAVVMRMENYASIDPNENKSRKGLVNITDIGSQIFRKWIRNPDALRDCAEVLIREFETSNRASLFEPDPVRLPKAFGKYELLDPIGEGAFGSVFSCMNTESQTIFAIKILNTKNAGGDLEEVLGRCRREIKALKAIKHPNVIRIFEDNLDQQRDFPGFVMELADTSLAKFLDASTRARGIPGVRPVLPKQEAMTLLSAVLAAVEAMHNQSPSLIHRDINPNNILRLSDGRWALADFSLAKFLRGASFDTTFATTHQGWGTPTYTAPEQWKDFACTDERADVFSLGVLIWELFTESWPPFDRTHLALSPGLSEVVLKATERDRAHRYARVSDLRAALLEANDSSQLIE
jgi:serine/threonine protein kinase